MSTRRRRVPGSVPATWSNADTTFAGVLCMEHRALGEYLAHTVRLMVVNEITGHGDVLDLSPEVSTARRRQAVDLIAKVVTATAWALWNSLKGQEDEAEDAFANWNETKVVWEEIANDVVLAVETYIEDAITSGEQDWTITGRSSDAGAHLAAPATMKGD